MSSDEEDETIGWRCVRCTYVNFPSRPGCEMCAEERPENYEAPREPYRKCPAEVDWEMREQESERQRLQLKARYEPPLPPPPQPLPVESECVVNENWRRVIEMDEEPLTSNYEAFDCPVCFDQVLCGRGAMLKECFHTFCNLCLREHIQQCDGPFVLCPSCPSVLQEREIRALVGEKGLARYHSRCVSQAESFSGEAAFHCKRPDCPGWMFVDDMVSVFYCPVCSSRNCIPCGALHLGSCEDYKQQLKREADGRVEAEQTDSYLQDLINQKKAMHCPRCRIVITKNEGCDWLSCLSCRLEICWVTRGPRWGPKGRGDTSAGCKCRLNDGHPCHPDCKNCH